MRILSLDVSTSTGYAIFENGLPVKSGHLPKIYVNDFNVNKDPNFSIHYPWNLIDAAEAVAESVWNLIESIQPERIVIENTVRGRNRHTQRLLEFIHFALLKKLNRREFTYMDPSAWRKIIELRLSNDDKKNNSAVSKGKKRGRVTRKHLAVRKVKELFGIELLLKDNDEADAILQGYAYFLKNQATI